jgi:hypothetical protein
MRAVSVGLLVLLGVAVPSAAARDRAISRDRTAVNLSAFGQGVVWSHTASDGRSKLVLRGFGAPAELAAAPATGRFDPDLGRDSRGRAVVVYTRCAGLSGRNCDIWSYDIAAGRETQVPGASSRSCSEFAPSVWEGAVAFGRSGGRGCNGLYVKGRRGAPLRLDRRIPADTDFRQGRVAYMHAPDSRHTYIRVFTIREGSSRLLIAGLRQGGERTRVSSPVLASSYVYFLFHDLRRRRFTVARSRGRANSSLQFADRSLPGAVDSIAVDGRTLYYANGRGVFQADDPLPRFGVHE